MITFLLILAFLPPLAGALLVWVAIDADRRYIKWCGAQIASVPARAEGQET